MSRVTVAIVDYGVGNHSSVLRAVSSLGYRCRIGSDAASVAHSDVIVLPGVGAFPAAMDAIMERGLQEILLEQARAGKPLLGICLGMQLLADASEEFGLTAGLGLIPGRVVPLKGARWHIGWNKLERVGPDDLLRAVDGCPMYFNHSFHLDVPQEYCIGVARLDGPLTAAVRRDNVVGLQFHPEKSQLDGRRVLSAVIQGLVHA